MDRESLGRTLAATIAVAASSSAFIASGCGGALTSSSEGASGGSTEGSGSAGASAGGGSTGSSCESACTGTCVSGRCSTALASGMALVEAVAVDEANVYWLVWPQADVPEGAVMKLPQAGGTPTTLAVLGSQAAAPQMAADGANVY